MTAQISRSSSAASDVALIVIGPNRRALRFNAADATKAAKLARSLKIRSIKVTTDRLREVARRLPSGKLSAKWPKGISQVEPALFKKLLSATTAGDAQHPAASPSKLGSSSPAKPGASDKDSEHIRGSIVLAMEKASDDAYYACRVEHVDGDQLTLTWVQWPEIGKFNRHRDQVTPAPKAAT